MKTEELINRFLEETAYLENESLLLLMAYGSRITGNESKNSDLDIFMVTENKKFIATRLIDGIKVETHCFPIEEVENNILLMKETGSTYFESVLKTGKIIKDDMNIYENLCNIIGTKSHKKRKVINETLEVIENRIDSFPFQEEKNKNVTYFSTLELLRNAYHMKKNCSNIPVDKVYLLYQNETLATKNYCLKLPSIEFRKKYLAAILETEKEKQQENLISFFKELQGVKTKEKLTHEFFSPSEIKQKLITINNHVIKCENMLIENHPYANALYYMTIENIMDFSKKIETNAESMDYFYELALLSNETQSKINCLENLFCSLDSIYRINYDDFHLNLQKKIN